MNDRKRPRRQRVLTRHLLHRKVRDRRGQQLGHLSDLILHTQTGRIEFGRVTVVDERTLGTWCLDVPWSQFRVIDGRLELDVSREVLRRVALGAEPQRS